MNLEFFYRGFSSHKLLDVFTRASEENALKLTHLQMMCVYLANKHHLSSCCYQKNYILHCIRWDCPVILSRAVERGDLSGMAFRLWEAPWLWIWTVDNVSMPVAAPVSLHHLMPNLVLFFLTFNKWWRCGDARAPPTPWPQLPRHPPPLPPLCMGWWCHLDLYLT